jgi:hypothetical protein
VSEGTVKKMNAGIEVVHGIRVKSLGFKVLRVEVQMAGAWCVRRMMVVIEFSS